jgi:pyrophosphatase PpaX
MQYETYLLDWDGCMAKTLHAWLSTYLTIYESRGVSVARKDILEKSWGNLENGPKNFGITDFEKCWQEIVAMVRSKVSTVELYGGVLETLVALKQHGGKLAIVTSSERSIIQPALTYHGIDLLIDALVTEEEVGMPKPHPEIIELALKKVGATKENAVIVGDTGKDIKAGQAAGIDTILVCHEENAEFYDFTAFTKLSPTQTITKFSDLV